MYCTSYIYINAVHVHSRWLHSKVIIHVMQLYTCYTNVNGKWMSTPDTCFGLSGPHQRCVDRSRRFVTRTCSLSDSIRPTVTLHLHTELPSTARGELLGTWCQSIYCLLVVFHSVGADCVYGSYRAFARCMLVILHSLGGNRVRVLHCLLVCVCGVRP